MLKLKCEQGFKKTQKQTKTHHKTSLELKHHIDQKKQFQN